MGKVINVKASFSFTLRSFRVIYAPIDLQTCFTTAPNFAQNARNF